jgi:hypothetical protein
VKSYQIKISLRHIEPEVVRRVVMPAEINFLRLHDVIQFAMGWQDYHLFSFDIPGKRLRIVDEKTNEAYHEYHALLEKIRLHPNEPLHDIEKLILEVKILKARTTKIGKYFENLGMIDYFYDFGDNWEHEITLEKILDDYDLPYPTLLMAKGNCPPEDCGGVDGYFKFLEAWKNKYHDEHESTRIWGISQGYGPPQKDSINALFRDCLVLKRM